MEIDTFNKTLFWLDEAVVKSFNADDYDLVLKIDAEGGGPGENVSGFVAVRDICYIAIPMILRVSDCIQLRLCDFERAVSLIPIDDLDDGYESDIKDGSIKVIQFFDGEKPLHHYVACYKYDLWQDPKEWSYE